MISIWHDSTQGLAKMIDMASILFVSSGDGEGCRDILLRRRRSRSRMVDVIHADIF
jgi:hypothetical protein